MSRRSTFSIGRGTRSDSAGPPPAAAPAAATSSAKGTVASPRPPLPAYACAASTKANVGGRSTPRSGSLSARSTKEACGAVFRDLYDDAVSRTQRSRERKLEKETHDAEEQERERRELAESRRQRRLRYLGRSRSVGRVEEGQGTHLDREEDFLQRREEWRQRRARWQERKEEFEDMAECTFSPTLHTDKRKRADLVARKERIEVERKYLDDPPDTPSKVGSVPTGRGGTICERSSSCDRNKPPRRKTEQEQLDAQDDVKAALDSVLGTEEDGQLPLAGYSGSNLKDQSGSAPPLLELLEGPPSGISSPIVAPPTMLAGVDQVNSVQRRPQLIEVFVEKVDASGPGLAATITAKSPIVVSPIPDNGSPPGCYPIAAVQHSAGVVGFPTSTPAVSRTPRQGSWQHAVPTASCVRPPLAPVSSGGTEKSGGGGGGCVLSSKAVTASVSADPTGATAQASTPGWSPTPHASPRAFVFAGQASCPDISTPRVAPVSGASVPPSPSMVSRTVTTPLAGRDWFAGPSVSPSTPCIHALEQASSPSVTGSVSGGGICSGTATTWDPRARVGSAPSMMAAGEKVAASRAGTLEARIPAAPSVMGVTRYPSSPVSGHRHIVRDSTPVKEVSAVSPRAALAPSVSAPTSLPLPRALVVRTPRQGGGYKTSADYLGGRPLHTQTVVAPSPVHSMVNSTTAAFHVGSNTPGAPTSTTGMQPLQDRTNVIILQQAGSKGSSLKTASALPSPRFRLSSSNSGVNIQHQPTY